MKSVSVVLRGETTKTEFFTSDEEVSYDIIDDKIVEIYDESRKNQLVFNLEALNYFVIATE